ncbi:MAG: DMT family transporter [Burkholderiaceae bacterium]|jgi:drug/metabolite transporter (DMT)-like permease
MHHSRSILTGIVFAIFASACFATLDTTVQYLSAFVPILMALWFRYTFQTVVAAAVLLPLHGTSVLRTAHPKFHLVRGLLLLTSTALAFSSLKVMHVSEFTAIIMITPLAITLMASLVLKEHVSLKRWLLVLGGFIGAMVIIRPGRSSFDPVLLLPLSIVVCNAAFQLLTSKMAQTENPMTIQLYTGLVGMVVASCILPFVWVSLPSWHLWLLLLLMGVASSGGHFLLILAYKKTSAATLTPYLYAQIVFAIVGGWIIFRYVPDGWSMLGISLIALCGVLGAWLTVREVRGLSADMLAST